MVRKKKLPGEDTTVWKDKWMCRCRIVHFNSVKKHDFCGDISPFFGGKKEEKPSITSLF